LAEGRDVLDLACGVGYGSQWLAKSGAKSVLGIDLAADAIEHAKKNYFHPSVSYRVEDATAMEYEQQFDLIACFEFIEHIDEQAKVLDGIKRALRPNGTLIISTPRPLDTKRTDFHVHELDFEPTSKKMTVVLFGHSHRPLVEERGGVIYLNPGSAGPRRFRLPVAIAQLVLSARRCDVRIVDLAA